MNTWDNAIRGRPGEGMSHTLSFGGAGSFFRVPYQVDMVGVTRCPLGAARYS